MTVVTHYTKPQRFTGLSSDTKPDAAVGSVFYETDTAKQYLFDGGTWYPGSDTAMQGISDSIEVTARGGTGLGVFIQDQTTGLLDVPLLNQLSTPTLASNTTANGVNRDITLTAGHGLVIGDIGKIVEILDTTTGSFFMQAEITGVSGDTITLDTPINRVYTTTESIVAVSDREMNVNGAVTPVVFSVLPFSSQRGDMVRLIIEMRDTVDMDFETFGGIPALTNGCVVRVNNGDGTYRNLYNFKSNGDIINNAFEYKFALNTGGSIRGFASRIIWGGQAEHGVVVRLDGALSESLELVIQDDLTGLVRMRWAAQGSEIQD